MPSEILNFKCNTLFEALVILGEPDVRSTYDRTGLFSADQFFAA
jgi:hypothetical protein